jgi:inhibitor of cysteine peptidase
VDIDERANGKRVSMPVGATLSISLTEKPTTGFRWSVAHAGEPACVLVDDATSEPAAGVIGGGGFHRWHFRAAAPGTCRIELAYRRAWQQAAPPAQFFTVEVDVSSERRSADESDLPEV